MGVSPVSPVGLFNVGAISPVALLFPAVALQEPAALDNSSTIVSLSGAGQLLSAVSTFQSNLAALQTGSGLGRNFDSLAAAAQNFVDTFNNLQSSINNLQGQFGAFSAGPLAGSLAQALNVQATAVFGNSASSLTTLAQVGINFQASPIPGNGGVLSVNLQTLQSAFNADQAGTFSLLGSAAQTLGNLASGFFGQAGNLSAIMAQQSLSLFTSGLMGAGSQGAADLFALELLTRSGSIDQRRQVAALSQYLLVSALSG